jgi:phage-related protein|tara:strand:- start:589 stop:930 length:342 start_codon:yes stop_codon:yes gene_type:complete
MATFPSLDPDFGAAEKAQPKLRIAEFGSGYSQRTVFGINQDPKVWTLKWEYRNATDTNTIEDFLEARAGAESFDWSPPDETDTYKWICRDWEKIMPLPGLFTINATFEQVFEA